jgi:hypothetical protein
MAFIDSVFSQMNLKVYNYFKYFYNCNNVTGKARIRSDELANFFLRKTRAVRSSRAKIRSSRVSAEGEGVSPASRSRDNRLSKCGRGVAEHERCGAVTVAAA